MWLLIFTSFSREDFTTKMDFFGWPQIQSYILQIFTKILTGMCGSNMVSSCSCKWCEVVDTGHLLSRIHLHSSGITSLLWPCSSCSLTVLVSSLISLTNTMKIIIATPTSTPKSSNTKSTSVTSLRVPWDTVQSKSWISPGNWSHARKSWNSNCLRVCGSSSSIFVASTKSRDSFSWEVASM